MTADIIQEQTIKGYSDEKITTLLLAAEGDLKLVKERINYRLKDGEPQITEADVLSAFLSNAATTVQVADSIKALMLLNYLQMLKEARSALTMAMGSDTLTLSEVNKTIQMIIAGVADMLSQAPVQNNNTVNLLQAFGVEGASDRVRARLETYAKVDERYGSGEGSSE